MSIGSAFAPARGRIYLDAATYGLPPTDTILAMRRALRQWQSGTGHWIDDFDTAADPARVSFAQLIGASPDEVATIPAVSVGVGLVAQALQPGDEVVVPVDEFTSVLYPFLVAERRGVLVRPVALADLADAIRPSTTLVATSLVQMQTGRAAPITAIVRAAKAHGTRILVDATQSVPVTPLPVAIGDIDILVAAGYKHLLCPRGASFLYIRRGIWDDYQPLDANWRSAVPAYGHYFGGPLELAEGAHRFDVSHAWMSWIGARESLRRLVEWQSDGSLAQVRQHAAALADGLGVPDQGTTLVCVATEDDAGLARAIRVARIKGSIRGGALRLSPHLHTTDADIARAIEVIRPFVTGGPA
jgi:selenocysteine lyase/cysteine desulfurase